MPKITINEFDYTGTPAFQKAANTVFIPGPFGDNPSYDTAKEGEKVKKPVLCNSKAEFEYWFGTESADKSWIMAHQLVQLGLPVLYWGDASPINPEVWEELKDKALYDIRFITAGASTLGEAATEESGSSLSLPVYEMVDCAYQRGDAIVLFSPFEEVVDVKDVQGWAELIAAQGPWTKVDMYGKVIETGKEALKYAAMFAPACSFPSIASRESGWPFDPTKTKEKQELTLPGLFTYLTAYAKSVIKNESWFAAAGSFRGVSPYKFDTVVDYGDAAINNLQTRIEGQSCVNTIAEIRPFGKIVWGNRTLLPNVSEDISEGGLKASHFLNIRHLCCDLSKALYRASRKWTFEQNDDILWANYQAEIKPLLDKMKSGRGIRGYRIIKVATNKKATLKAKIRINPIEAVEDFYLDIELTDNLDVMVDVAD